MGLPGEAHPCPVTNFVCFKVSSMQLLLTSFHRNSSMLIHSWLLQTHGTSVALHRIRPHGCSSRSHQMPGWFSSFVE